MMKQGSGFRDVFLEGSSIKEFPFVDVGEIFGSGNNHLLAIFQMILIG